MKRSLAAAITGAVFAGVLSAGVAQAKVVSTSFIGASGLRNAEAVSRVTVVSEITGYVSHVTRRTGDFSGQVTTSGDVISSLLKECKGSRSVALSRWTQVAGKSTRKTRDDKYAWKPVRGATGATDRSGYWEIEEVVAPSALYKAKVTKVAFTDSYGDLIVCGPAESERIRLFRR